MISYKKSYILEMISYRVVISFMILCMISQMMSHMIMITISKP